MSALAVVLAACPALRLAAQEIPQRPVNVTDQQLLRLVGQSANAEQIQQAIQQSGMTPIQIRARLRAAGYPSNLLDQYLAGNPDTTAVPSADVLRAVRELGMTQSGGPSDTTLRQLAPPVMAPPESVAAAAAPPAATGGLQLFGLDVFRRSTTQFTPVLTGPVDHDYRLGPSDELVLILTGETELAYQLPVTREGFIVIPQVGQLYVANLTLDQLGDLLYTKLGRLYSGVKRGPEATTHFDVTVSRVRVNQVYVIGEVARPGSYGVSALATVMDALYQAGGPTERGDFRDVRISRNGQLVRTLDLYDYLLKGNTRGDIRLEQGDVIFVPPRLRRVAIAGSVVRPALYDLAEGEDLRELIQMAGGLLPEAYTDRAQIARVLPPDQRMPGGKDRTVIDVDLNEALRSGAPAHHLEPGDSVMVFGIAKPVRNRVLVKGDVWRPGTYQLDPGMTLTQLIADAGGLKPDAFLERAHIVRLNPDSTRVMIPVSLVGIPPQGAPDSGSGGPISSSRAVPTGHLVFDPDVHEYDEVTVFSKAGFRPTRQVTVFGNVQNPGVFAFTDSLTLRDAVMLAGGLKDDAYLLEAEISRIPEDRRDGQLAHGLRVPLDSSYVFDPTGYLARPVGPRAPSPRLEPYDNVFIRRVPGWALQQNVSVTGEVRFPGRYTLLRRDERLLDVLSRAGGLTADAYVQGAQFFRAEDRSGRVGIDLERVLRDSTYRDNLILFAGDSLYVPRYQPVVRVEGGVNSPVAVAYEPRHSAGYYVDRAGGFSRQADKGHTYVVQPNGTVETRSATVQPGARVVVPVIPPGEEKTNWAGILTSVAAILTSALTVMLVVQRL